MPHLLEDTTLSSEDVSSPPADVVMTSPVVAHVSFLRDVVPLARDVVPRVRDVLPFRPADLAMMCCKFQQANVVILGPLGSTSYPTRTLISTRRATQRKG